MTKEILKRAIELDQAMDAAEKRIKNTMEVRNLLYKTKHDEDVRKGTILNIPDGNRILSIRITPETAIKALEMDLESEVEYKERIEKKFKELQ